MSFFPTLRSTASRTSATLFASLSLFTYAIFHSSLANALGSDIGDFVAPYPGHDLVAIYYLNSQNSDMYKNSEVINNRAKLEANATIFRYAHPTLIGDMIVNPSLILTHVDLSPDHVDGLRDTSGMADPFIGMPFWLYVDRAKREYFTIGPWLYLPIGEYDHKDFLNPGENRWKAIVQFGYNRGLSDNLDLDLLAEANFYGKNDEFGPSKMTKRQRPWYEAKGGVNYLFNDPGNSQVGIGAYFDFGGETELDGQRQGDEVKTRGVYVQGSTMLTGSDQLMFGFFRDLDVENGFKMSQQFRLRYLHVF